MAHQLLIKILDSQTVLWLSGGSTPLHLYKILSITDSFDPEIIALVDERYGPPGFPDSNEAAIHATGIFDQATKSYTILNGTDINQTSKTYNQVVANLIESHQKQVLIMGVGADGHTAGIFPDIPQNDQLVTGYKTAYNQFSERITLTENALVQLAQKNAHFLVIAFGEGKKQALANLLTDHPDNTQAASLYKKLSEMGGNVSVITDIIVEAQSS